MDTYSGMRTPFSSLIYVTLESFLSYDYAIYYKFPL